MGSLVTSPQQEPNRARAQSPLNLRAPNTACNSLLGALMQRRSGSHECLETAGDLVSSHRRLHVRQVRSDLATH